MKTDVFEIFVPVLNAKVPGTFAAETVRGNDGKDYAVFTVGDPENGSYPSSWAGTYRIDVIQLKSMLRGTDGCYHPDVFDESSSDTTAEG